MSSSKSTDPDAIEITSPQKIILCLTHPRACSTVFERIFLHHPDVATCIHESLTTAYFLGPEALNAKYAEHADARRKDPLRGDSTYEAVFEMMERERIKAQQNGKRIFAKEMAKTLLPYPDTEHPQIQPSLRHHLRSNTSCREVDLASAQLTEAGSPLIVPTCLLASRFHFTFLIRNPRYSVPSFYRLSTPGLRERTGYGEFEGHDLGLREVRRVFDFFMEKGWIGDGVHGHRRVVSKSAGYEGGDNYDHDRAGEEGDVRYEKEERVNITLVDADDLLDHPEEILETYCREVGIPFTPEMVRWDDTDKQKIAEDAFRQWDGWHDVVLESTGVGRERPLKMKTDDEENVEWAGLYGDEAQRAIRKCVDENRGDYEYLKRFAIKLQGHKDPTLHSHQFY